jgi:hypothetical protein
MQKSKNLRNSKNQKSRIKKNTQEPKNQKTKNPKQISTNKKNLDSWGDETRLEGGY